MSSQLSTKVPILVYHSVSEEPHPYIRCFSVSPGDFARQLDAIRHADMHPLTVSDFVTKRNSNGLPARPVVITFDDGWKDTATCAVRELVNRSIPATLYVTTGFLRGRDGGTRMDAPSSEALHWDDLPHLAAAGMEIGAHTITHPELDIVSSALARREIFGSRDELEDQLAQPIRTFAYPSGYNNARVRAVVAEAGFDSACVVRNALSSEHDTSLTLARILVRRDTSIEQYGAWLCGEGAPVAPRREALRTSAWRQYRRTRRFASGLVNKTLPQPLRGGDARRQAT